MTCTFFGHRTILQEIEPTLRSTLKILIEHYQVNLFYIGNHGAFDRTVHRILQELAQTYSIRYQVVLAYVPSKKNADQYAYDETVLPEGVETVSKRFAIVYRNRWMLKQSDYVVTYVTDRIGSGAAYFQDLAKRQGKTVINIAEICTHGKAHE